LFMGFKHFIWFGPASGETLIEGFKVSLICGYLNFASYMKIFFTTNLKPFLFGILGFVLSAMTGTTIAEFALQGEIKAVRESLGGNPTYEEFSSAMLENKAINDALFIVIIASIAIGILVYYILKLKRALIPYVSFLRLTSLDGKTMDGVLVHTKKIMQVRPWKYYFKTTLVHLLYLIPVGASILVYYLLSRNPVYSPITLDLITAVTFFVAMFPAVLFVELNYRNYCLEINQEYIKEHKKMLNDAINDLDKNNRQD